MSKNWSKLHHDVVFGKAKGRIIWQPRIGCWYDDRQFTKTPLPQPYTGLSLHDLYRKLDCSARLYEYNACFERIEDGRVKFSSHREDDILEFDWQTPVGTTKEIFKYSPNNLHPQRIKWEVETMDDLRIAIWREEHVAWRWNQATYDKLQTELGDLGAPVMFMPRMNVMSLFLEKMGIENGVMAIYEHPDLVEAYFKSLEICHEPLLDIINACPIDIINFGENIHCQLLSPPLFVKYHLPACQHRCEKLHKKGKFVFAHWDGNCKQILPYAKETGMDGIEAITPLPQGDVTLEDVKNALGDEMFLWDGVPALFFDPMYSLETLEASTKKVIELFAPKLVLGASDEVASTADINRVLFVKKIVDEYNDQFNC
ncbi:MAG: hypothetical protein LLF92_02570 [Planctomycetaceae bacterium]|nr:hypothetical protein [Planctomycetaceae bacterium]